MIAKYFQKP